MSSLLTTCYGEKFDQLYKNQLDVNPVEIDNQIELLNKGVHLVTVNDYLAQRDAEWMRPIYEFLGLSVGVVISNQDLEEKINAYKSDVIYATNNELGFDYLRDNMAHSINERVQCKLEFFCSGAIEDTSSSDAICNEKRIFIVPLSISSSIVSNME